MSKALAGFDGVMREGYAFFGDPALFTARDAAPVPCTVLIDQDFSRYGDVAQVAGKTVVLAVRTADVPAVPRRGDLFAITGGELAGKVLTVDNVISSDTLEHRVFAA